MVLKELFRSRRKEGRRREEEQPEWKPLIRVRGGPPVLLWLPWWPHSPWLWLCWLPALCWVGNIDNKQAGEPEYPVRCQIYLHRKICPEKFLFWWNNKWISNHLFKLSVVAREFFLCEICDKWHCSNLNFYFIFFLPGSKLIISEGRHSQTAVKIIQLSGPVSPVKLDSLVVPEIIQNGTRDHVVLDCPYSLSPGERDGIVLKWYLNSKTVPIYQWIPPSHPQGLGSMRYKIGQTSHLLKEKILQYWKPRS